MLSDLLPIMQVPYYRFNPRVPTTTLDETSPHKLREFQAVGRQHVVSGKGKDDCAALATLLSLSPLLVSPEAALHRHQLKRMNQLAAAYQGEARMSMLKTSSADRPPSHVV